MRETKRTKMRLPECVPTIATSEATKRSIFWCHCWQKNFNIKKA